MTVKPLRLYSPAKVNLYLEVLARRADGYHELETVMVRTLLRDRIYIEPTGSDQIELAVSPQSTIADAARLPADERNLAVRAAQLLKRHTRCSQGARLTLEKHIPVNAGLAGGSSNAATVLNGLNLFWRTGLTRQQLHSLAAELGSDVNFFVENTVAALCRGRGERVQPVTLSPRLFLVAARPHTGNSTRDVFSALQVSSQPRCADTIVQQMKAPSAGRLQDNIFNRLTESAANLNSDMAELLEQMRLRCQRPAFMSGSGSTCFVVARSLREARRLQQRLRSLPLSFLSVLQTG